MPRGPWRRAPRPLRAKRPARRSTGRPSGRSLLPRSVRYRRSRSASRRPEPSGRPARRRVGLGPGPAASSPLRRAVLPSRAISSTALGRKILAEAVKQASNSRNRSLTKGRSMPRLPNQVNFESDCRPTRHPNVEDVNLPKMPCGGGASSCQARSTELGGRVLRRRKLRWEGPAPRSPPGSSA